MSTSCVFVLVPPAGGITVSIIAFVFTIKFLCELAARVVSFLQNEDPGRRGDRSIYDYVRGNYLDPRSCKVSWDWKDPQEVGQTMSFGVHVRRWGRWSQARLELLQNGDFIRYIGHCSPFNLHITHGFTHRVTTLPR